VHVAKTEVGGPWVTRPPTGADQHGQVLSADRGPGVSTESFDDQGVESDAIRAGHGENKLSSPSVMTNSGPLWSMANKPLVCTKIHAPAIFSPPAAPAR
jgi:hypothetical protein